MKPTTLINQVTAFCSEILEQHRIVSYTDLTLFWQQFSTLICAGISLIQSCDILEKSQEKRQLRILIYSVKKDIHRGKTLSSSLKLYPHYFDALTCQLIKMGEHTGKLEKVITTIATIHEKNLSLRKHLQQALFYPLIVIGIATLVTLAMFIFIVPRFAELFIHADTPLPLLTRSIFYLAHLTQQYGLNFLFTLSIILILLGYAKYKKKFNYNYAELLEKIPLVKACLHKIILARFTRQLAMAFGAAIPITDALKLTAQACGHPKFTRLISQLANQVNTGIPLHLSMQSLNEFPQFMVQMIKIGEESGFLEPMLEKIANLMEADVEQWIALLKQTLEPLIMVVLGVLIGGLVIGMYLPIFKLGSTL